jgi:hypothetical protein
MVSHKQARSASKGFRDANRRVQATSRFNENRSGIIMAHGNTSAPRAP